MSKKVQPNGVSDEKANPVKKTFTENSETKDMRAENLKRRKERAAFRAILKTATPSVYALMDDIGVYGIGEILGERFRVSRREKDFSWIINQIDKFPTISATEKAVAKDIVTELFDNMCNNKNFTPQDMIEFVQKKMEEYPGLIDDSFVVGMDMAWKKIQETNVEFDGIKSGSSNGCYIPGKGKPNGWSDEYYRNYLQNLVRPNSSNAEFDSELKNPPFTTKNKETVNHPDHYGGKDNTYEVIKVIESLGLGDAFCIGNALKYVMRCDKKDNKLDDLKKAIWYLQRVVNNIEAENESRGFNQLTDHLRHVPVNHGDVTSERIKAHNERVAKPVVAICAECHCYYKPCPIHNQEEYRAMYPELYVEAGLEK